MTPKKIEELKSEWKKYAEENDLPNHDVVTDFWLSKLQEAREEGNKEGRTQALREVETNIRAFRHEIVEEIRAAIKEGKL